MRLFILLLLFIFSNEAYAEKIIEKSKDEILAISDQDHVMGIKSAPVTIIEYSSLSCPHCARFYINVILNLKQKYFDTGKVKYIHRDLPLNEQALQASILTHCVSSDKYYVFLEALFKAQKGWLLSKNYIEQIENIGKLGGLSAKKFIECQNDENLTEKILRYRLDAINNLGIDKTPSLYINNKLITGPLTEKYIIDLIEIELQKNQP